METGLENVPAIIACDGYCKKRFGESLRDRIDGTSGGGPLFGNNQKYPYRFNNMWNKKVAFCVQLKKELYHSRCNLVVSFNIVKITK
jgi:hypothetical protein